MRARGADYLGYALIDAMVDSYFGTVEAIGDTLEDLERDVLDEAEPSVVNRNHGMKRELLSLRRSVWPLREALSSLSKSESPLLKEETRLYVRDVHDHAVQILDALESNRDLLAETMNLYLSRVSNRTNEVMKVLTIIATIFMPLSFLAGWYGMNFKNMPEIEAAGAYPIFTGVNLAIAGLMLWFFRRRGWL